MYALKDKLFKIVLIIEETIIYSILSLLYSTF